MKKIWLKSYPLGIPESIDFNKYDSLNQLLNESLNKFPNRKAFYCMNETITYRELGIYSRNLAAWLQKAELKKGSVVAVMMPNLLQYPIAIAGLIRAGCIIVNINPLYTARELEHQLKDSGAEAIIVLENFAVTLEKVINNTNIKHVIVSTIGDMLGPIKGQLINFVARKIKKIVPSFHIPNSVGFQQVLNQGSELNFSEVEHHHQDIAFLQYTGGTTGPSKGAVLTNRNLVANILQNDAWAAPALKGNKQDNEQIVSVCALPLYHILALNACLLMGMHWGAMNILIPNPRDMNGFIKDLSKFRFNFFPGVNTLFNGLLNNNKFHQLDFSGLRVTLGGGMAVQSTVNEQWKKITGCTILQGYGLSETSPTATLSSPYETSFSGSIGLPIPSTEIAILDEDNNPLPCGEVGEIAIRGPQVMIGYWNNPEETSKVMTSDGFFKSGDIGVMDENGYITIVDRKKDMILVSGFNVYPSEIEEVISSHPDILECACVGVSDAHSGEAVKVFIVKKNQSLTVQEIYDYCKDQLTGYKRPKYVEFSESLPKSNVGKILRRELREITKVQ